jgi:hypothetical protein
MRVVGLVSYGRCRPTDDQLCLIDFISSSDNIFFNGNPLEMFWNEYCSIFDYIL